MITAAVSSMRKIPEESHMWGADVEEEPGWFAAQKPEEVMS